MLDNRQGRLAIRQRHFQAAQQQQPRQGKGQREAQRAAGQQPVSCLVAKWPQFSKVVGMREVGPFGPKQSPQADELEPQNGAMAVGYEPPPKGRVAELC